MSISINGKRLASLLAVKRGVEQIFPGSVQASSDSGITERRSEMLIDSDRLIGCYSHWEGEEYSKELYKEKMLKTYSPRLASSRCRSCLIFSTIHHYTQVCAAKSDGEKALIVYQSDRCAPHNEKLSTEHIYLYVLPSILFYFYSFPLRLSLTFYVSVWVYSTHASARKSEEADLSLPFNSLFNLMRTTYFLFSLSSVE